MKQYRKSLTMEFRIDKMKCLKKGIEFSIPYIKDAKL